MAATFAVPNRIGHEAPNGGPGIEFWGQSFRRCTEWRDYRERRALTAKKSSSWKSTFAQLGRAADATGPFFFRDPAH